MIRRFLDCSSGHLSPDTWHWLDREFVEGDLRDPRKVVAGLLAGGPTRYGWFVHAPEDPLTVPIPTDLATVLRHAREQGAEYVLFDCDAILLEGLAVLHPDFLEPAPSTRE